DPILLERLTSNLVENGIGHNEADGGWLCVRTATVDGWAKLYVSNTGPVVPAYEVEALFQPFRRMGRERVGGGRGFGLGLSIVRAVARAHGGEATAAPRDGGGLVVTVSLPGPGAGRGGGRSTPALSTAD
ncbi:MAG TPA: sensor histidine kinase, partial [Micromonosporaceae bacterium]|nr:sensor histidine kinase [Micromonosporaceae bacterium]